jgi:hypothetical protein
MNKITNTLRVYNQFVTDNIIPFVGTGSVCGAYFGYKIDNRDTGLAFGIVGCFAGPLFMYSAPYSVPIMATHHIFSKIKNTIDESKKY